MLGDPERAEQLEPDAALLVERFDDVLLERAEATLPPEAIALGRVGVADVLGLLREQGRDGEDLRPEAEQPLDVLGHEVDRP